MKTKGLNYGSAALTPESYEGIYVVNTHVFPQQRILMSRTKVAKRNLKKQGLIQGVIAIIWCKQGT